MRPDLYQDYRWLLEESLLARHEHAWGQQILNLFHLDRLVSFDPRYLESVSALVAEHRAIGTRGDHGE